MLSGRMRVIVGDPDMMLGVGEVAEFETMEPHWLVTPLWTTRPQ